MHICSRHTRLALREMSQCREDVYLEGTELMAWQCSCSSVNLSTTPCTQKSASVCIFDGDVCCRWLTWDYRGMPVRDTAHHQMHVGCNAAELEVWQACDRAKLVLNNFSGSITLPKHWTHHLPFPISLVMVTEPFPIYKWIADWTQPFTQYRSSAYRCKLAPAQDKTEPSSPLYAASQRESRTGCWVPGAS